VRPQPCLLFSCPWRGAVPGSARGRGGGRPVRRGGGGCRFTLLSRRDVSDDLRVIKDKAPEPVERPKAADREAAAQKNRPMHEWIYVGSFVEVRHSPAAAAARPPRPGYVRGRGAGRGADARGGAVCRSSGRGTGGTPK
jgi:hypothetical protein